MGLSEKFQAPPRKDTQAWRVVQFVVENGFRYDTIWQEDGRVYHWVPHAYPRTMEEAREFVVRYREHRVTPSSEE